MNRTSDSKARVVAVDAMRGVAIIGMLWAHAKPLAPDLLPGAMMNALSILTGASTPLFMLVAGTTIAILTTSQPEFQARGRFRLEYLLRGVFLIALGLLLIPWAMRVDVVLPYLGATFIAAVPFLFLRSRWLLGIAAVSIVAAPFLAQFIRTSLITHPELLFTSVAGHPVAYVMEWFFIGRAYHVTWLLPFILLGIALGRNLMKPRFSNAWLIVIGAVIIVGYRLYTSQVDESLRVRGDHAEILFDLGRALAVYGVVTLLMNARFDRVKQISNVIATPITIVGRMPLTVYVMHVLLIAALLSSSLTDPPVSRSTSLALVAAVFVACLAFTTAWGFTLGVGPVERLLGLFSLRHRPKWALHVRPIRGKDLGLTRVSKNERTSMQS